MFEVISHELPADCPQRFLHRRDLHHDVGAVTIAFDHSLESAHLAWWHGFWGRVGLVKLSSADGAADYLENLRTLDLYDAAAESRDTFPGTQAGVADLFSAYQDSHKWDPGAWWHWNIRMQVQANISSGAFDLNAPYFRLYQQNLAGIQAWTQAHMGNRAGICVPETMRFNGAGYEYETWLSSTPTNCDAASGPYYNARTISTGAEVGLCEQQDRVEPGEQPDRARKLLERVRRRPAGEIRRRPDGE